jgi:hypothetical protein
MGIFNQAAQGVSPEQSRAAFKAARDKTMVERQQNVPVLRPRGMGESTVIRQQHQQSMKQDHKRSLAINERAKQLYNVRVTEIHQKTVQQGKVTSHSVQRSASVQAQQSKQNTQNFNQQATQKRPQQEQSL